MVPYDPVLAQQALVQADFNNQRFPILPVGQQQLAFFCHNALQLAVLTLPGRDVKFVYGRIFPYQLGSHRPSYVNAILIQSRGRVGTGPCSACASTPMPTPFPKCRRLPGHFGGACGNCKWRDHAARCSVRDNQGGDGGPGNDSSDDDPDEVMTGMRRLAGPGDEGKHVGAGTQNDPVVV